MKTARALIGMAILLLLLLVPANALSAADALPSARPGAEATASVLQPSPEGLVAALAFACANIAYTDVFRSENPAYVLTPEFGRAVRAVANGESRYSPEEIPAGWWTAAGNRGSSRTGAEGLRLPGEWEACVPALVYLASMEYRSRLGRPALKPVFPVLVRMATRDLAVRAESRRQLAAGFAEREGAIAAKIREAERMGAGGCAPAAVADAKAELGRARRMSAEVRSGVDDTESAFRSAERLAEAILSRQQVASRTGFWCYAE